MNKDILDFVIFCTEYLAEHYSISGKKMYEILKKRTNILDYIIKNYEQLHTQGKEYLVEILSERIDKQVGEIK